VLRTSKQQVLRTLVLRMLVQPALRKLTPQVLRKLTRRVLHTFRPVESQELRKLGPQVLRMWAPRVLHTLRPVESRELRKSHWLLAMCKPCSFESWELKELKSSRLVEQLLALYMWMEQGTPPALAKHTLVAHLLPMQTPLWI
jgi:hypothetical protein